MKVDGKTAVVTGAASGIGFGLARVLAEKGCKVVLSDVNGAELEAAAEKIRERGGNVRTKKCDVRDRAAIVELADFAWKVFGPVDLVFNNAGVSMSNSPLIDSTGEEFDFVFGVNVKGVWNGCSVFGQRFVAEGREAVICNTASEHAFGVAHTGGGFYTASKHAVLGMSDVMRNELPDTVQVSVLCPGLVATDLHKTGAYGREGAPAPEMIAMGDALMGRGMDPVDIARWTIEGVERGDFIIATHPYAKTIADKRYADVTTAFENAPKVENPEKYDVNTVIHAILSGEEA